MNLLLLAFLGGLGAVCRDQLDQFIAGRWPSRFPWGILIVNCLGSFFLGILVGLSNSADSMAPLVFYLGFGFLGAFTTFSTWMVQSVEHLLANRIASGIRIVLFTAAFGLTAAVIGYFLGGIIQ